MLKLDYIEQWAVHFGKQDVWSKRLNEWKAN